MFLEFIMNFYSSLQGWVISGCIALFGVFLKKSFNGYNKAKQIEKEEGRKQFRDSLTTSLNETVNNLKEDFDNTIQELKDENSRQNETLTRINNGLLSVQGKTFREECKLLLKQEHEIITVEEMEQCTEDHSFYNAMGGNDTGDELYRLVTIKFNNQNKK